MTRAFTWINAVDPYLLHLFLGAAVCRIALRIVRVGILSVWLRPETPLLVLVIVLDCLTVSTGGCV